MSIQNFRGNESFGGAITTIEKSCCLKVHFRISIVLEEFHHALNVKQMLRLSLKYELINSIEKVYLHYSTVFFIRTNKDLKTFIFINAP